MSRIGRMPVELPKEVKISCDLLGVEVTGPKGHLLHHLPQGISVAVDGGKVFIQRADDHRTSKALQGLTRSLIANMITGVTRGFEKRLEIIGVGFRADIQDKALKLSLGFSHPILPQFLKGFRLQWKSKHKSPLKGWISNRWERLPLNFVQ